MKRVVFILLFMVTTVFAVEVWESKAPGAKGINSVVDPNDLAPEFAADLLNFRTDLELGALKARRGLIQHITTPTGIPGSQLIGLGGYYNSVSHIKMLIGINYLISGSDTIYANFSRTDTFGLILTDTIGTVDSGLFHGQLPAFSDYYDFEKVNNNMIICDGVNVPWLFKPYRIQTDTVNDTISTTFFTQPTPTYRPHITSLGLLAPGQLGVSIRNVSSSISGAVRYRYAYQHSSTETDSLSYPGPASNFIYPDNQQVMLTFFEDRPHTSVAAADTFNFVSILRQIDNGPWYNIDRLQYFRERSQNATPDYIDSVAPGTDSAGGVWLYVWDSLGMELGSNQSKISDTTPRPGSFVKDTTRGSPRGNLVSDTVDFSATYWIAYSYYDPVTGFESPLGPSTKISSRDGFVDSLPGNNGDSGMVTYRKGYTDEDDRPSWIRVYRSLANDSTVMIGLYELRANLMSNDSVKFYRNWIPGYVTDANALAGTITALMTNWNYGADQPQGDILQHPAGDNWRGIPLMDQGNRVITSGSYEDHHRVVRNASNALVGPYGGAVIRPPYIWGCPIIFSDVQFAMGRMWGIGDPEFPQRLYYSGYDSVYNWSPADYLSMDEDDADEIVAVEKAEGAYGDVLYVFKHNKILMVTGYDPERDLTYFPISTEIGAVRKQAIVKVGRDIYFLSPAYKIYRLRGATEPLEISKPVEDKLVDLFDFYLTGWSSYGAKKPLAYRLIDHIAWTHEDTSASIVYNFKMNSWSIYEYGYPDTSGAAAFDVNPHLSVIYDTLQSKAGFRVDNPYLVDDEGDFWLERDVASDNGTGLTLWPKLSYTSPCYGDGEGLWRIKRVIFNMRVDTTKIDTFFVTVLDQDGDSLEAARMATANTGANDEIFEIELPEHEASCVSFKITTVRGIASTGTTVFTIYSARAYYERVQGSGISY